MRARLLMAAALVAGAALTAHLWRSTPGRSAAGDGDRAARPRRSRAAREPQRDEALEAMLAELMRSEVAPGEEVQVDPQDELERLELAQDEPTGAPASEAQPTDAAALTLGDERVPNVARVEGLDGPFVSGVWPDGALMF